MNTRLLTAFALVTALLAGCGEDSQACFTNSIGVRDGGITGGCNAGVTTNSPTINLNLCPTCEQSSVRCDPDVQPGNEIFLDSKVNECDDARGCDVTSCLSRPVSCQLGSLAPGTYTVIYLTAGGAESSTQISVGPSGQPSCTL
jgi:hypothetical protein